MVQNSIVESSPPEAIAAREDFAQFRRYVCKHESFPHHEVWYDALITSEDSKCLKGIGGENLLILAPRGSSKSTVLLEFVAWTIGRHTAPDVKLPIKILYVSYTVDVAMQKSVEIKQIIQSDKFQRVFPWCKLGEKQSDKMWLIDRQLAGISTIGEPYTLACSGIKGAVASRRANLIAMDDLIRSPEQIESLAIREKMANNWSSVIAPVMFEGARAICLGTMMRSDDIYNTTFTPAKKWKQIIQSAIVTDPKTGEEKSYWEQGQSLRFLRDARERDAYSFSFQYQNVVQRVEGYSISPEWIVLGEVPDIEEFDVLIVGVDLSAGTKERNDWTVLTLGGRIGNRFYILDTRRLKTLGNQDKMDAVVQLWRDWDCPRTDIWFENVSYQASFAGDFVSYVINTLGIYDLRCVPVSPRGDKLARLRGVTGLLSNKLITFNQYAQMGRMIYELTNFGSTDFDDCTDSFIYTIMGLRDRRRLEIV